MKQNIETGSYVIFQIGSKQYQGVPGKTVSIEKINAEPGSQISFNEVLVRKIVSDGQETVEIGQPFLSTPVKASVIKHIRGPKIIVFHFKRRKKFKKKAGHRQLSTIIRVESI